MTLVDSRNKTCMVDQDRIMENARDTENRNRGEGRNAYATDVTGNANTDGDSVRTNDGNKSSIDGGNTSGQSGAFKLSDDNASGSIGNSGVEITGGFYYTPRGTIERIPIGYYVGSDNKLRKRRQKRDSSNADGNARTDRPSSDQYEENFSTEDFIRIDKPLNIR